MFKKNPNQGQITIMDSCLNFPMYIQEVLQKSWALLVQRKHKKREKIAAQRPPSDIKIHTFYTLHDVTRQNALRHYVNHSAESARKIRLF